MMNNNLQKTLFHFTSLLTTWFPRGGAKFFNTLIPPILGNKILVRKVHESNLKTLRKVRQFKKILVIPDIHIGDAVMVQGAVAVFRDFFPEARIDLIVKKAVACLIEGNPDISNLYPYFTGTVFPTREDIESIKKLVVENQYDLCFNASPFFEDTTLFPKGQAILNFMTTAPQVVRNDTDQTGVNHIVSMAYRFPHGLLSQVTSPASQRVYRGVPLTLADRAIGEAKAFLTENSVPSNGPLIFLNPDTASPYTHIPLEYQLELLRRLGPMPGHILLGSGFTFKEIERQLLEKLTPEEKAKVTVVPTSLAIDAYSALIDFTDVFISGDTGPLHMAAARKVSKSGNFKFRNKTFVISIFGATPPRLSGYDSTNPLFFPSNQDAQSRTYVSESPCRNITCVNKMAKTCKKVRCYEVLNVENIVVDVKLFLDSLKTSA
ncbi:MAG TPA: glycosyltransferase family 9 protein [bacterium]|nr:glycosyltransferase family 9 protein [bacterium]